MLDLYQDQTNENLAQLKPVQDVEPGIFANFLPGIGTTAMGLAAKAGRAASMGAFGAVSGLLNPVVSPGTFPGTTVARDTFFKWHDDVFNRAVDYWTPKPNEVGVAGEVIGSLLGMLPLILAGPAGPAAAVAATQLGTAEDLARKYPDVSATKANLVGAVQGAGLGLGIWMPILGQTLAQRVLVGGAGFNVLQGAAMRGVSGAILDDTKAAEDFKVFDGKAITLDVLLGMAFGAGAHIIPSQRQQGAEAWKKIDTWAKNLKPSEIDALMVLREGQHINEDSLPGKPATGADITAHVDRMRQAINDLASDKQVDVENIKVPVEQPIVGRETLEISPIESKPSADITAKTDTETTLPDTMGRIEPTMGEVPTTRDPQFTPDIARLAEAERQVADLQAEAERVRLEEGLPKQERQDIRPPNDITALDPVEQAKAVGRHIERALLQAGMDTKEAVANAAVWEAFAKSAHERYGVPPAELMAKWGVDVRRMDSADKLLGALEQRYNQDVNKSSGKQFSLEGETPEQVKAREDAAAAAVAKGEKPAPAGKKVTADQLDMFNTQNTLFQSSPTWYSELARQVDYLKMSAAPAKGWKDTIKGLASKGVIKPAEIEATGLNEWLDLQEGKVTKQQVQDFIAQNGVKVEEVMLGKQTAEPVGEDHTFSIRDDQDNLVTGRLETDARGKYFWQFDNGEKSESKFDTVADAQDWANESYSNSPWSFDASWDYLDGAVIPKQGEPKFGQYQLPGGENYRELLLTLPERGKVTETRVKTARGWGDTDGGDMAVERTGGEQDFRSSHFDTPNILAHIRFNTRIDADGKKVLFIEEIQSDWAQKGKKKGFDEIPPGYKAERIADRDGIGEQWVMVNAQGERVSRLAFPSKELAWQSATPIDGVPRAPFVGKTEAWVALSLKRMIRYAAENGFDRVAWTNGEQQVSRYTSALRKQVDAIEWTKTKDGVQLVGYKENGRPVGPAQDDGAGGVVRPTVRDKTAGRTKVVDTTEKESVLSDAIGKAMADKIRNDPAQSGVIEGADIKIDDTGMATFYDRIVPNVANDVLKKLGGGRVGEVLIGGKPASIIEENGVLYVQTNDGRIRAINDDHAQNMAKTMGGLEYKQSGFDITPAMLEKVMSGMPLFQGGTRGAVNFETGKTIIALFEKADKTTFQHETGHVFLEMTKDLASRADAPVAAMQDWATIADWLKIEGGTITREAHEQWARGWEKYLAEGVAPNEGLKAAFRRFRDWIIDVYKSLTNIDAPLNNQIRGVMARMLESQAKDPISKGGLEDPRLQQPEFRKALDEMGREAGWAEIGGSIIREHAGWEAEGEPNRGTVVGRSEWIPRAEWYGRMQASAANMPGIGGKTVRDAVRKALLGEKMTAGEKRAVTWMLNEHVDVMKRWGEVHGTDANPDGDPFEIANTQHDEGIEPTKANTLDMTLIDRAREVAPDAFEAIPTNYDDAQYMAAIREIVDANKPRAQETDQGGGQDAQGQGQAPETAQNGSVVPRAQAGGGDLPPPLTDAGETSGGSAGTNMVQNEARRFAAENPEIKVVVGTDDQGNTVHKSLNEILDDAAMETELAMRDVELFTVAAECLMGVA